MADVDKLAEALGVEPDRVFKTLMVEVDGRLVVGIVPVSGQLSLRELATAFGGKRAEMCPTDVAERITGWSRDQALGKLVWEVFVREGRPPGIEAMTFSARARDSVVRPAWVCSAPQQPPPEPGVR